MGVEYPADIDETRRVLSDMVKAVPGVIEGSTSIVLVGLGASSVDWSVRCAVHPDVYWEAREAVTVGCKKALDAAGIGIPYQTIDLNIVSNPS